LLMTLVALIHAHTHEEGRHLVVAALPPRFERVIVTVRAHHPLAEEHLRDRLHHDLWLARGSEEVCSWVAEGAAVGLDDLTHKLIVGFVLRDRLPNPASIRPQAFLSEETPVALKQVSPLQSPVIDVFR